MLNNIQGAVQLYSFHMLARLWSKSFKLGLSIMLTENFQICKLGFEEAEEPKTKMTTFGGSWESKGTVWVVYMLALPYKFNRIHLWCHLGLDALGRFFIIVSVSMLVIGLFVFSNFPGSVFKTCTFLRNCPFFADCPIFAHCNIIWSFVFQLCLL